MSQIRVAIVDDQNLFREGLSALLNQVPDLCVVGQAATGEEALEKAAEWRADVVLMDVRMPGMNGVAATREFLLLHPETKVIVLTTFDDDAYVTESLESGAAGYLLKNADPDQLASAIRAVHAGGAALDPMVAPRVIRRSLCGHLTSSESVPIVKRLSPRERDVLRLMAEGMTNSQIARRLFLSDGTVKNHVSHILAKLEAKDRSQAVRMSVEWGLT